MKRKNIAMHLPLHSVPLLILFPTSNLLPSLHEILGQQICHATTMGHTSALLHNLTSQACTVHLFFNLRSKGLIQNGLVVDSLSFIENTCFTFNLSFLTFMDVG